MPNVLEGSYDSRLVLLSIVAAGVGAHAGLELARRATADRRVRPAWFFAACAAMAGGIWSMHYTGMLAFRLPVPVGIHWPTALVSYGIGASGAAASFAILARSPTSKLTTVFAGIFMGAAGISGLHYTSMASMRFPGEHHYLPASIVLAIAVAVLFSTLALRQSLVSLVDRAGRFRNSRSALLMGAAICTMHYTAMAGTVFIAAPITPDLTQARSVSFLGTVAIGLVAILVLGVAIATSTVDRLSRAQVDLQQSFEQLRALTGRLQEVREEERTNVAREIHDELGQALTSIKIDLAALVEELPPGTGAAAGRAKSLMSIVDQTIQGVRRISTELRPGILDDLGLVAALEWAAEQFQKRTGVRCTVSLPAEDALSLDREHATALFRIFQETLTNVARHADATEVRVRLTSDDAAVCLQVHDNGRGFDETELQRRRSLGMLGMKERALLLGGDLVVESRPGGGTTVTVSIPHKGGEKGHA